MLNVEGTLGWLWLVGSGEKNMETKIVHKYEWELKPLDELTQKELLMRLILEQHNTAQFTLDLTRELKQNRKKER